MHTSRRRFLQSSAAGAAIAALQRQALAEPAKHSIGSQQNSAPEATNGGEDQRHADLGNGEYLNPILAGDHPDPSILKDGSDYYMVHSSFVNYPGLLVWHSKDLVNWQPIGPALWKDLGSVWAPSLVKHNGRYFIYFPALKPGHLSNYVVWADHIAGPWSEPIDLQIGGIDPGHVVGHDGKRWLFMAGGSRIPLADDGLSVTGKPEKVYSGWEFPDHWIVEGFAQEGPKILQHGDYYYMVLAEGGTAGPPTSHMAIVARSKSPSGPWENSPYNPLVRTWNREEKWWSKGHGTPVEGPDGKWYLIYHGYENGFYGLGRHTLMEPIAWTDDGWLKATGIDISKPIPKPAGGEAVSYRMPFSDDFSSDRIGVQWAFYDPGEDYLKRYRYENGSLVVKGKGQSPSDCSPLTFITGDHSYQMEVEIEISGNARAGLLVFYNDKFFAGRGFDGKHWLFHRRGTAQSGALPNDMANKLHLRLVNDRNVITTFYSTDGRAWTKGVQSVEVSGYHHNVAGGFGSLRPAIYAAGSGEVRFRGFKYRALP